MALKLELDRLLRCAKTLPTLPQIVTQILNTLSDESANAESLSEHIAGDPTIVARLLGAANAGAFGRQPVESLKQAILLLGIGRVKEITIATALIGRYSALPNFDARSFWLHSLGVSVCADEIALYAGYNREFAAICGLLHDIGQLLLFVAEPVAYAKVMKLKADKDGDLVDMERDLLGLDHAVVGAALARLWKLPETIAAAIAEHHAIASNSPPVTEMADVMHVANVLAHALDLECGIDNRVPPLSEFACARLGLEWTNFRHHLPRIEARFDNARLIVGL